MLPTFRENILLPSSGQQLRAESPTKASKTHTNSYTVPTTVTPTSNSGVHRNFVRGGGGASTNSVEDRENGDLGAVAP